MTYLTGADDDCSHARIGYLAVHFATDINRNFGPFPTIGFRKEANPATEEWNHRLVQTDAKLESISALKKKGSLLWEKNLKSSQVGLSSIHFGLGEVGID